MAPRLVSLDKGTLPDPHDPAVIAKALRPKKRKRPMTTTTTRAPSSEGTGGMNDPAWERVGGLLKNGLPG